MGHIDHGKTSLVAKLTGTDTDTHPEEKRRGITIDIGFASYRDGERTFAMIDAPGHQKYIGNLLAGVSKVAIGLMVVAGDQGIQEQTLEHAAILRALGVSQLVVVISRMDLCEPAQIESLAEELELFLEEEGFFQFPIVPVSVVTGAGIEALKAALRDASEASDSVFAEQVVDSFRMPIDRVISVPGRGCVVAGTVWSGVVCEGDLVRIAGGMEARVRGIESHGESIDRSQVGRRTAINLAGVSASDVRRGDELVALERFDPVNRLVVQIETSTGCAEIRCPAVCQFHTATSACEARITGVRRLQPGSTYAVTLESEHPIVATFGQHCLFRRPYPVGTFASGRIVAAPPTSLKLSRKWGDFSKRLLAADPMDRLLAWIDQSGCLPVNEPWLPMQLGISESELRNLVEQLLGAGKCHQVNGDVLVSQTMIHGMRKSILQRLTAKMEESENAWIKTASLVESASVIGPVQAVHLAVKSLLAENHVVATNGLLALSNAQTELSKRQQKRLAQMMDQYKDSRSPPTAKALAEELECPEESIESLILFATQQGVLVDVGHGYWFHHDVFATLCNELADLFGRRDEVTVAEIRDHWQLTRKHVLPLLEYCDRVNVTVRNENVRTRGSQLPVPVDVGLSTPGGSSTGLSTTGRVNHLNERDE